MNYSAFNESTAAGFGGGFTNDGGYTDSPSTTKKNGAVRRLQNVVPVVIRMLRDCKDEELRMFRFPVQMVSVVGIVTKIEVESTKATYEIEDHTAIMKAWWWLETDNSEAPQIPAIKEGSYVKAFGSLRCQDGEKTLMVLKMFPVDDGNVITSHLLEVINTRLQAEALSKDTEVQIKKNNPGANLANSMSMMNENTADNGQQQRLTEMQSQVLSFIQSITTSSGPHCDTVVNRFPVNRRREAMDALEFLVSEGYIYSTIDNEHFRVTQS